jgi:hypothetical protein
MILHTFSTIYQSTRRNIPEYLNHLISVLGLRAFNLEYCSDRRYMSVPYRWYVFLLSNLL